MAQSTLTRFQILPRPNPAGLFFCLASAESAGLLFFLVAMQPHTSVYSGIFVTHANYTATTPKSFTGLYSGVSAGLTRSSAHNTAATQTAYIPPASRWRAYRQAQHLHRYQIPPPRRTLYRPTQPPYYNKVYKGAAMRPFMDPCQTVQHSADHASGGGSLHPACIRCRGQYGGWRSGTGQQSERAWSARHSPPGGAVQRQGARRAARNHWRLVAASLFGLSPDS